MFDFQTFRIGNLHWVQQKILGRVYELRADESVIAVLSFPSAFSTHVETENTLQCWSFKRRGFSKKHIVIHKAQSRNGFATFTQHLLGNGTLQLEDGRSFQWAPVNFWHNQWMFYQAGDIPAVRFLTGCREFKIANLFKTQADIEIVDSSLDDELLCLLLSLGFYLLVIQSNRTASAAAACPA